MQNIIEDLRNAYNILLSQGVYTISTSFKNAINDTIVGILKGIYGDNRQYLEFIDLVLKISNILYNNTDVDILLLEDGIYDLLIEEFRRLTGTIPVGAPPIRIVNIMNQDVAVEDNEMADPVVIVPNHLRNDMLFAKELCSRPIIGRKDLYETPIMIHPQNNTRKTLNKTHEYPELVGTLDKCKFVLCCDAEEKGVIGDSNVAILERDFFAKHISMGILHPQRVFSVIAMLKYDGASVEGDMYDFQYSSRGDAINGNASDLTSLFANYTFPNAPVVSEADRFGVKFEAIMTYDNLERYNALKNKNYKNCRTAISGLFSSLDGYKYMDLVTLVPLETSLDLDPVLEIEFMNKYYTNGVNMIYTVITGNYQQVLFGIKKWTEEAEYMRDFIPFMYDGVVISYVDRDIRQALGRTDAVNKYSMAVKFNALKKSTIFRGYYYTVGQDGSITPMITFDPVEFMGTIHDKCTGHSYERFKQLGLVIGDIIDIEYVNDVMCYATKPLNQHNENNFMTRPQEQFPTTCPVCGHHLVLSKSGKTVRCPNIDCDGRKINRMVNMLQKINIKDFSEAYLLEINKYTLTDLLNLKKEDVMFMGEVMSNKFMDRMNEIKTKEMFDYEIVGSLGFNNIGRRKWKLIFANFTLHEILSMPPFQLLSELTRIKGIGSTIATTIVEEMEFFKQDLYTIVDMPNVRDSKGIRAGKKIRFTGCRDKELMYKLIQRGHDCTDGGVTKDTDILIVPVEGHTSKKTQKVGPNCIIVPIQKMREEMDKYL